MITTDLQKSKQGPPLVMKHKKALHRILELSHEQISPSQGVDHITLRLNHLYNRDKLNEKFEDLKKLESHKQCCDQSFLGIPVSIAIVYYSETEEP